MHPDAFFAIGRAHLGKVCQDYARAGRAPNEEGASGRCFAVVSDGCSTSPDTDVGARLVVLNMIQQILRHSPLDPDQMGSHVESVMLDAEWTVNPLSTRCLDATLLALVEDNDGVAVTACGDGVIFAVDHDGRVHAWEIDMAGTPGYPSYLLDRARLQAYLDKGWGRRTIRHWADDAVVGTTEGRIELVNDDTKGLVLTCHLDAARHRLVGVASDGLTSFRNKEGAVPLPDVLRRVVDVRAPRGVFMIRTMRWFLEDECPKLGWYHEDDVGVAAIWLGNPPCAST